MTDKADTNGNVVELRPTQYLEAKRTVDYQSSTHGQVALIILNSPISDFEYLRRLYQHASFCLCADGGANRLYDLLLGHQMESGWADALRVMGPDIVHGDLDSLDDTVRKRYEQIGVEISQDDDQYSTDFGKAINKVVERLPHVRDLLVLGSIGGRIDQGIGLLHELFREQKFRRPGVRFWFFSEASVSVVLQPGTTLIHTPLIEGLIKSNIGILPLYGRAMITTTGLEWDVQDWPTEMGGQVSTSNHIVSDQISVTTNKEVLFTVERTIDQYTYTREPRRDAPQA